MKKNVCDQPDVGSAALFARPMASCHSNHHRSIRGSGDDDAHESGRRLAVSTLSELARQRILQQEAEMERDRAQLALYQAQFEPHFIYNSLNALYGLIVTRDSRAEQSFMKFIELTRYTCSFVVGLAHIASYNRRMVIVNGYSQSLPIGRTYAVEIDKCL